MRFDGTLTKEGKFWIVEIPALNAATQGRTRTEAYAMAKDLLETMGDRRGFSVTVHPQRGDRFEVEANDARLLLAILLRRQREKSGLTLAAAAERLGQRSRNAYARYERGEVAPTVEQLEKLLEAVAPGRKLVWRLAS